MVDGIGTITYGSNPIAAPPALGAGQLASIDAPLANDTITFGYDQLGRVTTRAINGSANSETWTFDSLGRVSTDVNKLGTFSHTYAGATNRLTKMLYPGGASANYLYFPNAQDKRLQQIKHVTSKNALISQFDYRYDLEGQIQTWTKNYAGLAAPQRFDLGYDNADQLTTAPLKNANTNALIKQSNRTLTYDLNGSITSDGGTRTFEWLAQSAHSKTRKDKSMAGRQWDGANRLVAINYTGFKIGRAHV